MTPERLDELHAQYREKYGVYEYWHPTLAEAERDVRECLIEIDRLRAEEQRVHDLLHGSWENTR